MACQPKSDKKTKFIQNLEFLRNAQGMSQRDLAQVLGLSQATISLWMNGGTSPKSGELEKIAMHFSVSMDDLWRGDVSEGNSTREKDDWKARALKAESKIRKLIPTCKKLAEGITFLSDVIEE